MVARIFPYQVCLGPTRSRNEGSNASSTSPVLDKRRSGGSAPVINEIVSRQPFFRYTFGDLRRQQFQVRLSLQNFLLAIVDFAIWGVCG